MNNTMKKAILSFVCLFIIAMSAVSFGADGTATDISGRKAVCSVSVTPESCTDNATIYTPNWATSHQLQFSCNGTAIAGNATIYLDGGAGEVQASTETVDFTALSILWFDGSYDEIRVVPDSLTEGVACTAYYRGWNGK